MQGARYKERVRTSRLTGAQPGKRLTPKEKAYTSVFGGRLVEINTRLRGLRMKKKRIEKLFAIDRNRDGDETIIRRIPVFRAITVRCPYTLG